MDLADRTVMLLGGSGQASVRALAGSKAPALAEAAWRLLATDDALREQIISVGLPIVAPDDKTVYRGSSVVVPPEAGDRGGGGHDPLSAAPRGWVDLRPAQFGVRIQRAGAMVDDAEARAFTVEDKGTRIKR